MGVETAPLPLLGAPFWHCTQFLVRRSIHWSESPDHYKHTNEWAWQRPQTPERIDWRTLSSSFSTSSSRSENTDHTKHE